MQYVESFKQSKKRSSHNRVLQAKREEEKMLHQAIKNSLIEKKNINANLADIQEMVVFHPSEEEFKNPLEYIDSLYHKEEAWRLGTIKIVPPKSFKPSVAFDMQSNVKLPTRY